LIGIPLAESLFGQTGVSVATVLSAVSIPIFNILAVVSLSVFGKGEQKPSVKKILLGIVKNPLIQSIFLGLAVLGVRTIFLQNGISFRLTEIKPMFTVLDYLSRLATPLALLMLGVQFEFSAVRELKREIIFGTLMRTVIVPVMGLGIAFIFFRHFGGAKFAALVALFATPVAVSSVPMAQEMGADHTLAGQLVVWTTLVSSVTVFLISFLLKLAGIF
jgi:predicted permease